MTEATTEYIVQVHILIQKSRKKKQKKIKIKIWSQNQSYLFKFINLDIFKFPNLEFIFYEIYFHFMFTWLKVIEMCSN